MLLSLLVILAVAGAVFFFFGEKGSDQYSASFQNIKGASEYESAKRQISSLPPEKQHIEAHRMGAMLFETLEEDGLLLCDNSFDFGCYHGFFGRYVAERGATEGSVAHLASICKKVFGNGSAACEHGIGHGIMEFLGRGRLDAALALCTATEQKDPLSGCTGGVFMENNAAIRIENEHVSIDVRRFNPADPYAPCTSVPRAAAPSCYFEQSLWWLTTGRSYEEIGTLCAGTPEGEERDACYEGWGPNVAERAGKDPEKARDICSLIRDEHGRSLCVLGVVFRLHGSGNSADASALCDTLTSLYHDRCAAIGEGAPKVR